MTVIAAAWEYDSVSSASNITPTVGAVQDSLYANNSLLGIFTTQEHTLKFPSSVSDFWTSVRYNMLNYANTDAGAIFTWFFGANPQFRVRATATPIGSSGLVLGVERNNSGIWTSLGTFAYYGWATSLKWNVYIKINGTTGEFKIHLGSTLVFNFAGNVSSTNNTVDRLVMSAPGSTYNNLFAEAVVATHPTFGERVKTLNPSAAGSLSTWTGTFADVDDVDASNADSISTNSVGAESSFNIPDLSATIASASKRVVGVVLATRAALQAGSTPANLQHIAREGGVTSTGANVGLVNDGVVRSYSTVFSQNPRTAAPWTVADINSLEIGGKAV
jgi:hypothetical protein